MVVHLTCNEKQSRFDPDGELKSDLPLLYNGKWMNQQLTLQLDHINGISDDNRKENLRFLCPNCHSQTKTFGGNNIKTNSHNARVDEGDELQTRQSPQVRILLMAPNNGDMV